MKIELPQSELDRLRRNMVKRVVELNRELGPEVRQRALNIAGRALTTVRPKGSLATKRHQIKGYMNQQIAVHIKLAKSGKRKGRFIQRGGRHRQLMRKHLIAQMRNAKAGRKGLYGKAMSGAAGKLAGMAQRSVGFVASVFLPAINALNGLCRFKVPASKTRDISRWRNSAGYGWAKVDMNEKRPSVEMLFGTRLKTDDAKVGAMISSATTQALVAENQEIERHMKERAAKLAAKMNRER